jgi:hypothetical protein
MEKIGFSTMVYRAVFFAAAVIVSQAQIFKTVVNFSGANGANPHRTHSAARRKKCCGIHVEAVESLCDPTSNRFVLKAIVYPSKQSTGFVGYGEPSEHPDSF